MFIMQVTRIEFIPNKLVHTAYYDESAREWIKQWTPEGNIKMAIGKTHEEALKTIHEKEILPMFERIEKNRMLGFQAKDFCFVIAFTEFEEGEPFWGPNVSYGHKYNCLTLA